MSYTVKIFRLISLIWVLACAALHGAEPERYILAKLETIRAPKVRIATADFREVFDFLKQKVRDWDPDPDPAQRGVTMMSMGDFSKERRTVNYSRENIGFCQLLQDIATLYRVDIHVTSTAVVATPHRAPPFPNPKSKSGKIYLTFQPKRELAN